ncbi:hypothetical protein D3C74_247770 [compost metagenome]
MNPFEVTLDIGGLERRIFAASAVTCNSAYRDYDVFSDRAGHLVVHDLVDKGVSRARSGGLASGFADLRTGYSAAGRLFYYSFDRDGLFI